MNIKINLLLYTVLLLIGLEAFAQESTRNPWGMTQQQYQQYENTSVSELNAMPGADSNFGALSLPNVSYITNQPDNGSSPTIGQFRFLAAPSHYLKDDPIVFPNQPGKSHLHMFFGNTRADANSEVGTGSQNDLLVSGASTVQGGKGANPSSYWIPALVDGPLNGCDDQRKIILPDVITVYYKSRRPGELKLIPEGLELIGGNLPHSPGGMVHGESIKNSSGGDFREGARWGFYDPARGLIVQGQSTIPQTNPNGYKRLRASIGFPQCFMTEVNGGFKLSSSDHLSHQLMLENAQGWNRDDLPCPSSHPNRIPKVEILVDFRWPDDNDVSGWRLSSDVGSMTDAQVAYPGGSLHGDILFAWNEKVQQAWKGECLNPNDPRNCSIGQTGTQWILDRIENTATIKNLVYTGSPYLPDPYDTCGETCPTAGTTCNDNNPNTNNDVEDGNCNCAGTCLPANTPCNDGNSNTQNDVMDANCNCVGTQPSNDVCQATNSPNIDGYNSEWLQTTYALSNVLSGTVNAQNDLSANFQVQWDNNYLYVFGKVNDNNLKNDSEAAYQDDGIEVYIDGGNERNSTYDSNDHQLMFRVNDNTVHHYSGGQINPAGVNFAQNITNTGYNMEIRIAWSFIGVNPSNGIPIGIDIHVNDDDDGGNRDKKISWNATIDQAWNNPTLFGTMRLSGENCENCPDEDNDDVCNADDVCPNFNNNLIGQSCDDGDSNTINDIYGNDCICKGTTPSCDTPVRVNPPGNNLADLVNTYQEGTCFYLPNGNYNFGNVKPKNDMKFTGESRTGVQINGNGFENAFHGISSNVEMKNITFYNFNNDAGQSLQEQAPIRGSNNIWANEGDPLADGWMIDNIESHSNIASGLFLGHNFTVTNSIFRENGVTGMAGDDFLGGYIYKNTIYGNGANRAEGALVNGGGIKITKAGSADNPVVIKQNEVYNNNNVGIWGDVACHGFNVINNYVHDHDGHGILYEISDNAYIADNTLLNNTPNYSGLPGDWSRGGITIAESKDVLVENNTVTNSRGGITVQQTYRPSGSFEETYFAQFDDLTLVCSDITIQNNTINGATEIGIGDSESGAGQMGNNPNVNYICNTYNNPNNITFYWMNGQAHTYAQWQAAGRDNCSTSSDGICKVLTPPNIDGNGSEWSQTAYDITNKLSGTINSQNDLSGNFQIQWDDNYLYVFGNVKDNNLVNDSQAVYQDDGIEVYIDGGNEKANTYDQNDHQLMFRYDDNDVHYYSGGQVNPQGVSFAQSLTNEGYNMKIKIAWTFIGVSPANGIPVGIDIHINDDDDGGNRDKKIAWHTTIDQSWNNPSLFNTMTLEACETQASSTITIYARGNTGEEGMTLTLNGELLESWYNIPSGSSFKTYSVTVSNPTTINSIRVNSTSGQPWEHALIVDKIVIDDKTYQSENSRTESYGAWTESTGCVQGYKKSEWLSCPNAWFEYKVAQGVGLAGRADSEVSKPVIIFDTDMGPDIDDALALAMLHASESNGNAKIAAVTVSRNSDLGARYCDVLNTFYNRPNIPVGKYFGTTSKDDVDYIFSGPIAQSGIYPHDVHTTGSIKEGYKLMREVLAGAADKSVIIAQTGFFVNTAELLKSGPDNISPLTGKQLVEQKVAFITVMGGRNNSPEPEFNVKIDVPSAQYVFANCPIDIIQSEFNLGYDILYPLSSIQNDFNYLSNHPVKDAYLQTDISWHENNGNYYDMRSWDLTSVLVATESISDYFNLGVRGNVVVQYDGRTIFTANPNGNVRSLGYSWEYTTAERQKMINRMLELTRQPPDNHNGINRDGINYLTNKHIQVYPNPALDVLNVFVDLESKDEQGTIQLLNLNGKAMIEKELNFSNSNEFQLDLKDIPSGLYILEVGNGLQTLKQKIIKY